MSFILPKHCVNTAGTLIVVLAVFCLPFSASAVTTTTTTIPRNAKPIGSINASSLVSTSSNPILSGTASSTKTVQVTIKKKGNSKTIYKSRVVKVRNEEWKVKVSKKLPDGVYDVKVSFKNGRKTTIVRDVLTVNKTAKDTTSVVKSLTTLIVAPVPLLSGGVARASGSVPISYLQIINIGQNPAFLNGFWIKQNGSASAESIIGLTTTDDAGGPQGSTNIIEGSTPFKKDNSAFVPTSATFAPGQMRLFTIRAVLSGNILQNLGKQLMIDVVSIDTDASEVRGTFPIRGTTWNIVN